jgi:hypothetical protein
MRQSLPLPAASLVTSIAHAFGGFMVRIRAAAILLLILFGSGCVSISRQYEGARLPVDDITEVEVGMTTRQEVLDRFGPPLIIRKRDFEGLVSSIGSNFQGEELTIRLDPKLMNEVFIYEYRRVNRWALILILFNYFSSTDKSDRLMFFFDGENQLAGVGVSEGTKEL